MKSTPGDHTIGRYLSRSVSHPVASRTNTGILLSGFTFQVCAEQGLLVLVFKDIGVVQIYNTVKREDPRDPILKATIDAGSKPAHVLPNANCTLLAVASENDGEDLSQGGLTIIRDLDKKEPTISSIPIDQEDGSWDDSNVLGKGLHMPLTKSALEYWDEYSPIAEQVNFSLARENYKATIFLEPKAMAWTRPEETELIMNLQKNNGLVCIDMVDHKAVSLAGYGLKG